jgi:hypothetical protein
MTVHRRLKSAANLIGRDLASDHLQIALALAILPVIGVGRTAAAAPHPAQRLRVSR